MIAPLTYDLGRFISDLRVDPAWINGTAAHALDFDGSARRGGHLSAVLVPAILAKAEAIGASGTVARSTSIRRFTPAKCGVCAAKTP